MFYNNGWYLKVHLILKWKFIYFIIHIYIYIYILYLYLIHDFYPFNNKINGILE